MTSRRTTFTPTAPNATSGEHWSTQASCNGMVTEDFYIGTTDDTGWYAPRHADHIRALRALCASCPVRLACLDDAIATFDRHAFRGGMTPPERRRYARKEASA